MSEVDDSVIAIQRCKPFVSLRPSEARILASHAQPLSFGRGGTVFQAGDESDCLFILTEGCVVLSHREKKRRAIIEMIWPGELFGQCALVHSGRREATCEVPKTASVVKIPLGILSEFMDQNPRFGRDLMKDVGTAMRRLAYRLVSVLIRPKRERLVDILRYLAESRGVPCESGVLIPAPVTHQELGEMIGASRETVTVILGELRRENAIDFDGRRIIVCEMLKQRR
jgi:CRP-like cAMP-binding protein